MDNHQALAEWARHLDLNEIGAFSTHKELTGQERKFVYDVTRKLRRGDHLSLSQLRYLKSIIGKIDSMERMEHRTERELVKATDDGESSEVRHLTVRLAWHDSAWNGRVCENPGANVYCIGEHSLLSDRIRTRRNLEVESREGSRGSLPTKEVLGDYIPPCFWSINAFSPSPLSAIHDNPAAKQFPPIQEQIPAYSVLSWPFKLSFVRSMDEQRKYGKYYPTSIFESRVKKFQNHLREGQSLVFLYCKFSNPVSGEDHQYLLVGCAFLKEKGPFYYFNPPGEVLRAKRTKSGMQNFPTLNWALRYSLDIPNSGVRLPYHEYLSEMNMAGGISRELLDQIKVTISEPELTDGFEYVAKHVDDDQAIYLLMKLRKSILIVKEHGLQIDYDANTSLERTDELLAHAWKKRGYIPGLKALTHATLRLSPADTRGPDALSRAFQSGDSQGLEKLRNCLSEGARIESDLAALEDVLCNLVERIEGLGITADDFLRLAALNLTRIQFERIIRKDGLQRSLKEVCGNPYLIYEEYEPGDMLESPLSGEKVDGPIDLFKVDIALFPHLRFLKRNPILHQMKISDQRRLRAVCIATLLTTKDEGHCFDEASSLQDSTRQYPLFYHYDTEYEVNIDFRDLPPIYMSHFQEKLVTRNEEGRVYFYLKSVFDDEQYVANTIRDLIRAEEYDTAPTGLAKDLKKAAQHLSSRIGKRFDRKQFVEERESLYKQLPRKRFFAISGSPGSGKSYEILRIVSQLSQEGEKSLILTLTGKAALRLKNNDEGFEGVDAKTIDKFLVECKRLGGAMRVVPNLIIDEMSMVDLDKLAEILKRVNTRSPYFKRLILVGDESQLPPIGAGKVFEDILEYLRTGDSSLQEHWAHLDVNCRAEMSPEFLGFCRIFSNQNKNYEKWISRVDKEEELCSGLMIRKWHSHKDLHEQIKARFVELFGVKNSDRAAHEQLLDRVLGVGEANSGRKYTLDHFQILSPYRRGLAGASGLNFFFQEEFRSLQAFSGQTREVAFKLKDKVMHTQNEYDGEDLLVSNGSLGVVTGYKRIHFVEHEKPMSLAKLQYPKQLELAYAITIHKSQGSGFNHVFIVIPDRYGALNRELLYTALTRAKESVTVFIQVGHGDKDAANLLDRIRRTSAIEMRRTSLFKDKGISYAYIPGAEVSVKSRIEYIIFKKLEQHRAQFGGFDFKYEETYKLKDKPFDISPDFTIRLASGKVIYWEHLGRLTSQSYVEDWDERRKIYEDNGDLGNVLTTHELRGISDSKISAIIESLLEGTICSEDPSDRYSRCHVSLR